MNEPIERELKILVTKDIYEQIQKSYPFTQPCHQINTYYDTDDEYIKKQNGACRIRTIGNKHIFTLKIRKDPITHIEWEKEIHVDRIDKIKDKEVMSWLSKYDIHFPLHKIITFSTNRQTYDMPDGQLCLDETIYENHMDYEIEYEYKKVHNSKQVLNKILAPYHIFYQKNCPSKIARAWHYNLCVKR